MKIENARRHETGFTLIELMIVIAIIGILAAIAIPQYEAYIVSSKASAVTANFKNALNQVTAGYAAAAAGQTVDLNTALNVSSAMSPGDPASPAYYLGGKAQACGQVGVSSATISPGGPVGISINVDNTCPSASLTAAIASAVSAAGYPAATTSSVYVNQNGGIS